MAKKGNRVVVQMACTKCNSQNYTTQKNKINMQVKKQKLNLNKFCNQCDQVVAHKEAKIKKGKAKKLRH
ncbi:MAG: 50S ribosomal protein L33 [bacterium]